MSEWKLGYDIGGTKCAAILGKVSDNKISVVEKAVYRTGDMKSPAACIEHF